MGALSQSINHGYLDWAGLDLSRFRKAPWGKESPCTYLHVRRIRMSVADRRPPEEPEPKFQFEVEMNELKLGAIHALALDGTALAF